MKTFLGDDFLLNSALAQEIYASIAGLGIIDYHCHLSPKEIAENRSFSDLAELWLSADHYKWRLMRINGVDERFITGDACGFDKFMKWAETVETLIGSPMYHWVHLELRRYFGCEAVLSAAAAKGIWEHCNAVIASGDFNVLGILDKFGIETVCTTDDPIDDLRHHKAIRERGGKTVVLPTFRPSNAYFIDRPGFTEYIEKLSAVSGIKIDSFETMLAALKNRISFFHENGCRLADNSLEPALYEPYTLEEVDASFKTALSGGELWRLQADRYKSALLTELGREYAKHGWAMQIHMNAIRNNSTRMYNKIGVDAGFDSIDDRTSAAALSKLLDSLDVTGELPKTIIYNLNPSANNMMAAMAGNYFGRVQHGPAWWFNDSKTGIAEHLTVLGNHGLLASFIGMTTDSRSFLSFPRHEYFRRILANHLANEAISGEFPADAELLKRIAADIAYNNAGKLF